LILIFQVLRRESRAQVPASSSPAVGGMPVVPRPGRPGHLHVRLVLGAAARRTPRPVPRRPLRRGLRSGLPAVPSTRPGTRATGRRCCGSRTDHQPAEHADSPAGRPARRDKLIIAVSTGDGGWVFWRLQGERDRGADEVEGVTLVGSARKSALSQAGGLQYCNQNAPGGEEKRIIDQ
jgi:hypothetical protein